MGLFNIFAKNKITLNVTLSGEIRVERTDDTLRFIGTSNEIFKLAQELRKIASLKSGQLAKVDKYIFKVSDDMTEDRFKANWIELPARGWNVVASKFLEVIDRYEENPFFFNSCGFTERLPLDIGVEITDLTPDEPISAIQSNLRTS